jgi:hypothetical protein
MSFMKWINFGFFALFTIAQAQASHEVKAVTIRSGWGGLGSPQDITVAIHWTQSGFRRNNNTIESKLVQALVSALESPLITKPDINNLGITQSWLNAQVGSQKPRSFAQATTTTPGQRAFFDEKFTDLTFVAEAIPNLWRYTKFDDYPGVSVEVEFEDGSKMSATTHSYYVFMIPWQVAGQNGETYNADISRAVAALLPNKAVNKERLGGSDLAEELTQAAMGKLETAWNIKGTEEMVGDSLAHLRRKYQVTEAKITPYHHPEYGTATYKGEPEESNLHVSLRKEGFPSNVADAVVLHMKDGRAEGVDEFLANAEKYEKLALSIPWLNEYIKEHPRVFVRISYVHDASLGDKALRTFKGDMKLRERQDLIEEVSAQQKEIALLIVGTTYSESYWLVFPDKRMLLWRYGGPSGLLKWSTEDFREGECADYRVNNGGCSGRQVSPDGELISEGVPRDVSCMNAWRTQHPVSSTVPDPLFEVEEHGRVGMIDRSGQVIIPFCFDALGDFSEGLARFERDGRWGYVDHTGKIVIPPTLPWAEDFHEGLAHVQVTGTVLGYDGRWGYIDPEGKIAIPPISARMIGDSDGEESAFHEGLAMIEIEGDSIPPRKGFIDKSGKLAIPARFTYVYPFAEGVAAATEDERGESGWGYIDHSGNWTVPPQFSWASSFQFGLAPVNRTENCGYIDKTGQQIIHLPAPGGKQDCASAWGDFADGLSRWLFGTKYGFIDRNGKTVIQPQFDLTYGFSEGLAAVQIGKKWGYIDVTGKTVVEPRDLWNVKPFHGGLAQVQTKDGQVGYIDKTGEYVWGPTRRDDNASE